MPKKTKAPVKMAVSFLALLMIFAGFTAGCQPTPEKPVVVNKNEGVLEEAVDASPEPAQAYKTPERWTMNDFKVGGKLTVSVDAEVIVPDTNTYPVYSIVPGRYTQEQADKIIDYFFEGRTLYEGDKPETKAELQERLVRLKHEYQEALDGALNEVGNLKYDSPPEDFLESIEALEQKILKAPETSEARESDGKLKEKVYDAAVFELLFVTADIGKEEPARCTISNTLKGGNDSDIQLSVGKRYYPAGQDTLNGQAEGISATPEQARKTVQDMLDGFGFGFMEAKYVYAGRVIESGEVLRDDLKGGYRVECVRRAGEFNVTTMLDGMPKTFGMTAEKMTEIEKYSNPWPPETLYVYLDDSGVTAIDWHGYSTIADTVSENVALLPFEQIGTLFENGITAMYAWTEEPAYDKDGKPDGWVAEPRRDISIGRIELGMARIPVKNDPESYQLVPAWEFYGTWTYFEEDGTTSTHYDPLRSLLTLNAVDGSVIDRRTGY